MYIRSRNRAKRTIPDLDDAPKNSKDSVIPCLCKQIENKRQVTVYWSFLTYAIGNFNRKACKYFNRKDSVPRLNISIASSEHCDQSMLPRKSDVLFQVYGTQVVIWY